MSSTWSQAHPGAKGFTAIELMVVVAILAVLTTLAAPSFHLIIERWRVRQTVEGLQSTLQYARSEAVRRGGGVFIQKLPQGTNGCTLAARHADWGCGWVVFVDRNGNRRWDPREELQRFDTPARTLVIRSRSAAIISVDRWGQMGGFTAMGFAVAPSSAGLVSAAAKGICVSSGGRIRVVGREGIPCA
ncbi:GspH/FimT family pseudopilin [Delftia acidovorans]|uniref:GspH/FimT family pseudopilin n=1 Tax=Delftia acidovorans TaxID=80866 RepID=UPI00359FDBC5